MQLGRTRSSISVGSLAAALLSDTDAAAATNVFLNFLEGEEKLRWLTFVPDAETVRRERNFFCIGMLRVEECDPIGMGQLDRGIVYFLLG